MVAVIINIQLVNRFSSLTKNIGMEPRKSPIVVRPKASPGAFFNTETRRANVIAMVMENIITPISETIMI